MDADLLRRACERAGLEFIPGDPDIGQPNYWHDSRTLAAPMHGGTFGWEECDPALPSYVADILVAMVRERDRAQGSTLVVQMEHYILTNGDPDQCIADATAEQRIRAAMEVLEAGDG